MQRHSGCCSCDGVERLPILTCGIGSCAARAVNALLVTSSRGLWKSQAGGGPFHNSGTWPLTFWGFDSRSAHGGQDAGWDVSLNEKFQLKNHAALSSPVQPALQGDSAGRGGAGP